MPRAKEKKLEKRKEKFYEGFIVSLLEDAAKLKISTKITNNLKPL